MDSILWLIIAIILAWFVVVMAGGIMHLFSTLLIGGIAGWLAGKFMHGRGFGILKNVLIGIVGAVVGGILFAALGLHSVGVIGSLATATVGAIVLLYVVRSIRAS